METFRRLEWLLWSRPVICTEHWNLIYIFNPQTAASKLSKANQPTFAQLGYIPWKFEIPDPAYCRYGKPVGRSSFTLDRCSRVYPLAGCASAAS